MRRAWCILTRRHGRKPNFGTSVDGGHYDIHCGRCGAWVAYLAPRR